MKQRKLISILLTLALCLGVAPTTMATEEFDTSFGGEFAASFDLRDKGYVTPVKKQDPWGSCWAFGGISAAESSILSMLAEKGEPLDAKDFDLSEKHLIWFSTQPITKSVDQAQAGEGMFMIEDDDPNYPYNNGGFGLFITTLFSSGVGPVTEASFPYRGKEGVSEREYLKKNSDLGLALAYEALDFSHDDVVASMPDSEMTVSEVLETLDDTYVKKVLNSLKKKGHLSGDDILTVELFEDALLDFYLNLAASPDVYSKYDDWSISELGEDGFPNRNYSAGYTMVDGNILPDMSLKDENDHWIGINPDGMKAVKSELMKGHGISAAFKADQSVPGQAVTEDSYLNTETWAQYTHKDENTNHVVCIVGWDDNYSKENFNAEYMPPGNGAWLVKNSWGSETDYVTLENGMQIGKGDWGIEDKNGKHTGYFWLSFYDKSLSGCESMSFDTDLYDAGGDFDVWMYDYMPAMTRLEINTLVQDENILKTANVFKNDTDADAHLYAVSARTALPDAEVKYAVYKLNENFANPEDGTLLETKSCEYAYPGFHREKLSGEATIHPGESIAVVVEETVVEDEVKLYEYSENAAYTKPKAESEGEPVYCVAVVNPGESFLYETDEETGEGKWTDYSNNEFRASVSETYVIDNFSIKAYVTLDSTPTTSHHGSSYAKLSSYSVSAFSAGSTSHGTMKFNTKSANAGENVTVTALPDEGYKEIGITVLDAKGNTISVTKNDDGTYTFTMPDTAVTITPVFEEIKETDNTDTAATGKVSERFTDVKKDEWYTGAVQWAVDKGIMSGISKDEFAPDETATRAMVVTMLWRLAGMPVAEGGSPFSDVKDGEWYADAATWAVSTGAVSGISEDSFAPDVPVTREQLAAILYRYAQSKGRGFTGAWAFPLDFADAEDISEYAYESLCWMTMNGIINGMEDGNLAPQADATRAQIATLFELFALEYVDYEEFKALDAEEQKQAFANMTGPEIYKLVKMSDENWPVTAYDLISPENAKETIILYDNNGSLHFNLAWPIYGGFLAESIASIEKLSGKLDVSRDGGDGGYSMSYGKNEDGSYPNDSQRSVPKTSANVRTGALDVDQYKKVVKIVVSGKSDKDRIKELTALGYTEEIAARFLSDQAAWLLRDEISGPDNIADGAKIAGHEVKSEYGYYGVTAPWVTEDLNLVGGGGQLSPVFSWGTLCASGLISDIGTAKIN